MPSPLFIGEVELADGTWIYGFVVNNDSPSAIKSDITRFRGWKNFLASEKNTTDGGKTSPTLKTSTLAMRPLMQILVANRGEITVRIIATLRKLGIHAVAVYSKEDRGTQHVRAANSSFLLEGDTVAETYLSPNQIINVAKSTGVDGIMPGYGFLRENADFAEVCEQSGLVWIGPKPRQMRKLGLKHLARHLLKKQVFLYFQGARSSKISTTL